MGIKEAMRWNRSNQKQKSWWGYQWAETTQWNWL